MVHFNIPGFRSHKRIVMLSDEQLDALKQGRAGEELAKRQSRLTPAEIAAMQSELSASAARAAQTATQTAVRGGGANPATAGTTVRTDAPVRSSAPTFSVGDPLMASGTSSTAARASSTSSSAARQLSSSTSSSRSVPTSTSTSTSTSSSTSSSTSTGVRTLTITSSQSQSLSSATPISQPSTSAEAPSQGSSTGLGTGAVVGIVLAVLVGVVILGSAFGWVYRKFASRGYKDNARWRKLDEDVTPYPSAGEKYHDRDDIYGGAAAPVIGSNRALANSMQRDSNSRPMTEYDMYARNRAGVGSGMDDGAHGVYGGQAPGHGHGHGAYGQPSPYGHPGAGFSASPISPVSPYPASPAYAASNPNAQQQYGYGYPDEKHSHSPPGSRQLLGGATSPYGHEFAQQQQYQPELMPVPLGRPAAPQSYADIAHREDYADELPSADYPPHAFSTAAPVGVQLYDRPAGSTPTAPVAAPAPLPTLRPMSSFANGFNFGTSSDPRAPSPNYNAEGQDEQSRQKQLYGEVSRAAGFPEPKTPYSAAGDRNSMNFGTFGSNKTTDRSFLSTGATADTSAMSMADTTMDTSMVSSASSFSAPERLPRSGADRSAERAEPMPMPRMPATQPYEHGRPLSPLVEVSTPSTSFSVQPPMASIASSSIGHGREVNPFDHLQPAQQGVGRTLVAPHSAAASSAQSTGSGFPSARYPPPSPGGMSVPGSVGGSPREAVGGGMGRRSVYDEEDAYGGI